MQATEKLLKVFEKAAEDIKKTGYAILKFPDDTDETVWFFVNKNYAEIKFEMSNGVAIGKTIVKSDSEEVPA